MYLFVRSPVRAFRHTASLTAMHIFKALLVVGNRLRNQLAVAERQLEAEVNKKKSKTKINEMKTLCKSLKGNIHDLEDILDGLFSKYAP